MQLTLYRHAQIDKVRPLNRFKIPFYELVIVLRGNLEYYIDQEKVSLQDRDMLFLKPGTVRRRKTSNEPAEYISIHFLSEEEIDLPVKIQNDVHSSTFTLIMSADKLWKDLYPEAEPLIEHLIRCIIDYTKVILSRRADIPLVFELKRYMNANLHRTLSVTELASQFLISPSYCNAVFKRETGTPLMTYFTQLRIEKAKKQLVSDELTLKEVAESIGIEDYGYFARTFKKHTGLTPMQYKNKFLK